MKPYEITEGDVRISDDKKLLDRRLIHGFLSGQSYWAQNIPMELMERAIEHSLCFGIYKEGRQIGFARAVTDRATFAWLADVFIVEEERGRGWSKKFLAGVFAHPALQGLRIFMLGTRDAHTLYEKFGFAQLKHVERFMEIRVETGYKSVS
jgi:GNAT superfamily N-acetyltransferase